MILIQTVNDPSFPHGMMDQMRDNHWDFFFFIYLFKLIRHSRGGAQSYLEFPLEHPAYVGETKNTTLKYKYKIQLQVAIEVIK